MFPTARVRVSKYCYTLQIYSKFTNSKLVRLKLTNNKLACLKLTNSKIARLKFDIHASYKTVVCKKVGPQMAEWSARLAFVQNIDGSRLNLRLYFGCSLIVHPAANGYLLKLKAARKAAGHLTKPTA